MPLNLYETDTFLKPVNLNFQINVERVPSESDEPPNSNEGESLPKSPKNERVDCFSDSDSDSDSDSVLHMCWLLNLKCLRHCAYVLIKKRSGTILIYKSD